MLCLSGCSNSKKMDIQTLVDRLAAEGITHTSYTQTEEELYDRIYISDKNIGHATICVYKKASDAQKYWEHLDAKYDNLKYSDNATAIGDLKDVYDASIKEWIHYEDNVIISVEQYIANEWAVSIGEDGEEYYGDGTNVSETESPSVQKEKASKLEDMLLNCLK